MTGCRKALGAARRKRGAIRPRRTSLRKLTRIFFRHKRLLGFMPPACPPRYTSYWTDARSAAIGVMYSSTTARWTGLSR